MTLSRTVHLALLGPHHRAALLQILEDPQAALQELVRGLPPSGVIEGRQKGAFAARSLALSHWLNGFYRNVASGLFLSAELFSAAGDLAESAVSRALLGLFYAESNPLLTVVILEACLPQLSPRHWLARLGPDVLILCKARLGEKVASREDTDDELAFDSDRLLSLHILWYRLRTEIVLEPSRTAGLDLLVRLFLERGLYNEAALAASDLASNFSVTSPSGHPLLPFLPDFDHIPLSSRPLVSALYHLAKAQEEGVPFDTAVLPLHSSVSSICRYPLHLIHATAKGD